MTNSLLIIDDDSKLRKMLSEVLSEEGYSVEVAEKGKDAIKICEKVSFDAALVDVELPDIKGTELLTQLRSLQPKMSNIIITGHPSVENAMKAVNLKADGYIQKPFEIPAMIQIVKKIIEEKANAYSAIIAEMEKAKEKSPVVKFQNPDKW